MWLCVHCCRLPIIAFYCAARVQIDYVGNVILFSSGLEQTCSVTDAVSDEVSIKYSQSIISSYCLLVLHVFRL